MKNIFLIIAVLFSTTAFSQVTKEISNRALDGDLNVCVNDGGVKSCPLVIDGSTGKVTGPVATSTDLGFVIGGKLPSDISGASIDSGYVGEIVSLTERVVAAINTQYSSNANALVTLPAGKWIVFAYMQSSQIGAGSQTLVSLAVNGTDDNSGLIGEILITADGASFSSRGPLNPHYVDSSSSVTLYAKARVTSSSANVTVRGYAIRIN